MEFDDVPEIDRITEWRMRAEFTNTMNAMLIDKYAETGGLPYPAGIVADIETCCLTALNLYMRPASTHRDWEAWLALESQLHRLSRRLSEYHGDTEFQQKQERQYPGRAISFVSVFVSRQKRGYKGTGTWRDEQKYWSVTDAIREAKAYGKRLRDERLKEAANRPSPDEQVEQAAHTLATAGLDVMWAESVADGTLTAEEVAARWLNREQ